MRSALLLAFPHAGGFQILVGPDEPPETSRRQLKRIVHEANGRRHPEFARLEFWESGTGVAKVAKFGPTGDVASAEASADDQPAGALDREALAAEMERLADQHMQDSAALEVARGKIHALETEIEEVIPALREKHSKVTSDLDAARGRIAELEGARAEDLSRLRDENAANVADLQAAQQLIAELQAELERRPPAKPSAKKP